MPREEQARIVSFQIPLKNDSLQAVGYRTVHVVVPKPVPAENEDSFHVIVIPLMIVIIISVILLLIGLKIKAGSKTNKILDTLEGVAGFNNFKTGSGK